MLIFDQLKEETRVLHQSVERRMGFDKPFTLERYQRLLKAFYGLYEPLEDRIFFAEGLHHVLPDIEGRRKTCWLREDLHVLGQTPEDLQKVPRYSLIPKFQDMARVLGILYVVEGATLGGAMIGPLINQSLNLTASKGSRFFYSYGEERASMWQTFKKHVSEYVQISGGQLNIVAGARNAFLWFDDWLAQTYD